MTPHLPHLPPPIVLTFAASDPSGGAGIQADLMTLSSMGCHALSVITALTVQDTIGIDSVLAIDADWVEDQARALLEDMPVDVSKIGLLGSIENIAVIAAMLSDFHDIPMVFSPVLPSALAASLAHRLSVSDAVHEAQDYTRQTRAAGFRPGMGKFIPDRFF